MQDCKRWLDDAWRMIEGWLEYSLEIVGEWLGFTATEWLIWLNGGWRMIEGWLIDGKGLLRLAVWLQSGWRMVKDG